MGPYTTYENEIYVWYRISSTMINLKKKNILCSHVYFATDDSVRN